MNTEAEIVEELKPKPFPDSYQILVVILFLITLTLTVTVHNDDALYYYSSNFMLTGWIFLLISI
jgi:hypothetical protein